MELERGDLDAVRPPPHPGITALLPAAPPQRALGAVSPEESTTLLRRCTALAARARVELLGGGAIPPGSSSRASSPSSRPGRSTRSATRIRP